MRRKQERIIVGNDYDKIRVLSICENSKYRKYNCECLRCGAKIIQSGQEILKYQSGGCLQCREKDRLENRILDAQKYVNQKFNDLTVKKIIGMRDYCGAKHLFARCECRCGNFTEIPLTKVTHEAVRTCGHDRAEILESGRKASEELHVDGTFLPAIDGNRKINKNNKTGINGVSWMSKYKKYRAYINFKRKQYNLGLFSDLEDAAAARKEAEEQVYGDFLKWYEGNHPDLYKKSGFWNKN